MATILDQERGWECLTVVGKVVSIPPHRSMNLGQQKIILKVQLSRAILFSCAKNDRVELVLQPVITSTFPHPCFFPQHGTWLQTAKQGFGSESRAAGHIQLPQDRSQDSVVCE